MILLHRLRTQNFKQLTDLDLAFPERGTVLIEGLNEAGKSSLFEAVFFALYGWALVGERDYKIGNLKSYNAEEMRVELDFSVDGRSFTVSRRVVANQKTTLTCPPVEGHSETFGGNVAVERRLREELRITPEALLNTCFVEQKGLERLESLQADQRRETVNELLNLRVLSQLGDEYRITHEEHAAVLHRQHCVEVATLDAALPALRSAAQAAHRCLVYSRILVGEQNLRELERRMEDAHVRRSEIRGRQSEIAGLLRQVDQLKARLAAIDGDLSHRARAWSQAVALHAAADEEVRKLEELAAGLPARETQLIHWEDLGGRLEEQERLETRLAQQRRELQAAEARLTRFDELQRLWDVGEAERRQLETACRAAEAEVVRSEAALRDRQERNRRCERLALLLRHTAAHAEAEREAAALTGEVEATRATAARLEEQRRRLGKLEELERQLRQREEDQRALERATRELAGAEQELRTLAERQERIEALEVDLARLETDRLAAENEERLAGVELRKTEARVALAEWAEAAERCAEADPATGHLAELQRRQSEALLQLQACKGAVSQAVARLRLAGAAVGLGLLLAIGGVALQQVATLGAAGIVLLLLGVFWTLAAGRRLDRGRADEAASQKLCDSQEGERRAVEREVQTAAAGHERCRSREAECRRILEQSSIEVPATPADAHRTIASLSEIPVAAARQRLDAGREHAGRCRNEAELARRSLTAEKSRGGPDPAQLQVRIADLTRERERFQQATEQASGILAQLDQLGTSEDGLKELLDRARTEVVRSRAAGEALPDLESRRSGKSQSAARERGLAATLAAELAVAGEDPCGWAAAAERERSEHQQDVMVVTDSALQSTLEEARRSVGAMRQQLTRLDTEQKQHRMELDREPRVSLAEAFTASTGAVTATEAALAPLSEVRSALERADLPSQSPELRPRLAVLRREVQEHQEQMRTLPERSLVRDRRAADVEAQRKGVATAWRATLEEEPPSWPDEAVQRLPAAAETLRQQLVALDEPALRSEDRELQEESGTLDRLQATWKHQQEQKRQEKEALLGELGLAPDAAVASLAERFPELVCAGERDSTGWGEELERRREAARANQSDRRAKAGVANLGEAPLDLVAEQDGLAEIERNLAVKRRAGEIVTQTRQSIVNRVMPLTMQNMRQILPLLTEGRYQDAEWNEQSNLISVYDMRAGSFQRKRVFSGGARDQISLSLRLAFALATLPGEHNVRPGWLFLDEPLSSFDHARTQALVDLLTQGLLRKQFAQIFLISHSHSFDPGRFDYRIRMDGGQVVESTLPAPLGAL